MDRAAQNASEAVCHRCGTWVDAGRFFCEECGTTVRKPASVIQSASQSLSPPSVSSSKGMAVTVIKCVAGISAVISWLWPLRAATQILLFLACMAVLVLCEFALSSMDDVHIREHADYWPKPMYWSDLSSAIAHKGEWADRQKGNSGDALGNSTLGS
jgi:hypothetical protein